MDDRLILHIDANCFYASVELVYYPELKGKALVVGGSEENRHGVVLTKTPEAKAYGIQTGEPLIQARRKCKDLIVLPPHFDLYKAFSKKMQLIFYQYTNQVEPYGLDECFLDCTKSQKHFGTGIEIAKKITDKIDQTLGIHVSCGVSFSKVTAKFGSDYDKYRKPYAITEIKRDHLEACFFKAPVEDLFYCGKKTAEKLRNIGITTIGDLAHFNPETLKDIIGNSGIQLQQFALGNDPAQVKMMQENRDDTVRTFKSIGKGLTVPKDLVNIDEVKSLVYTLSEYIGAKLRWTKSKSKVISITIRTKRLTSFSWQCTLDQATSSTERIAKQALKLFQAHYTFKQPVRSITIQVSHLIDEHAPQQINFLEDLQQNKKSQNIDSTLDEIRQRFGSDVVQRAVTLKKTTKEKNT